MGKELATHEKSQEFISKMLENISVKYVDDISRKNTNEEQPTKEKN
jgi:hypothetical protein